MSSRRRDLYRKLRWKAVIPWDCIIEGHQMRPHPSGPPNGMKTWWYCGRPGCTHEEGVPL